MNALSHHELSDFCLRNIRLLFLPFCLIGVPHFLIALRRRTAAAAVFFTASLLRGRDRIGRVRWQPFPVPKAFDDFKVAQFHIEE